LPFPELNRHCIQLVVIDIQFLEVAELSKLGWKLSQLVVVKLKICKCSRLPSSAGILAIVLSKTEVLEMMELPQFSRQVSQPFLVRSRTPNGEMTQLGRYFP